MKKEIVTMLLASALLTSSLTACDMLKNGGDDIQNTTPEITTVENDTTPIPDQSSTPNLPNTQTEIEHPVIGENITCTPISYPTDADYTTRYPTEKIKYDAPYNMTDHKLVSYIYVEEWDIHLKLTIPEWTYIQDILFLEDSICVLALFDPSVGNYHNVKVITMQINQAGVIFDSHINEFEWDLNDWRLVVFNLYNADHFYMIYLEEGPLATTTRYDNWLIEVYESTDLGKTWIPKGEPQGGTDGSLRTIRFLTRSVGYCAYFIGERAHQYTVYVTKNGGETWELQSFACLDPNSEYSLDLKEITVVENGYVAIFEGHKISETEWKTFKCFTSDFQSWTLIE